MVGITNGHGKNIRNRLITAIGGGYFKIERFAVDFGWWCAAQQPSCRIKVHPVGQFGSVGLSGTVGKAVTNVNIGKGGFWQLIAERLVGKHLSIRGRCGQGWGVVDVGNVNIEHIGGCCRANPVNDGNADTERF